ncbi:MAG: transglutaminase-like domain-containing protein [Pseudomonadota bacterium]
MGYATQAATEDVPQNALPPDSTCLTATAQVDCEHPAIAETVAKLIAGLNDRADQAVSLHAFVRDQIRYGWTPAYDREPASKTLRRGIGFSKTKAVLLVALLRAAGIPSRIAMTDISSEILKGIVSLPFPWIDHALTEAWIDGKWVRTDSYIVDAPLLASVRSRLINENAVMGYGVHREGTDRWDGRSDAFVQWITDADTVEVSNRPPTPYPDLNTFNTFGQPRHRLGPVGRLAYRAFTARANRRTDQLRNESSMALAS